MVAGGVPHDHRRGLLMDRMPPPPLGLAVFFVMSLVFTAGLVLGAAAQWVLAW